MTKRFFEPKNHQSLNNFSLIKKEVELKFIRSSGPGGQNVNKTNSAVQLRWNIWESLAINEEEKQKLSGYFKSKLTSKGELIMKEQSSRDQEANIRVIFEKLENWISKALHVEKKRIKTKPTLGSKRRRLSEKKIRGDIKKLRSSF